MIRIERVNEDGDLIFIVSEMESPMSGTVTLAKNLFGILDSKQMLNYFVRELNYLLDRMAREKRR